MNKRPRGFIVLPRDFFLSDAWRKARVFSSAEAWLDLVQRAAWADHEIQYRNKKVRITRGELPISIRKLADDWGWSKSRVHRFIGSLQAGQQSGHPPGHIAGQRTEHGLLILTIADYDSYVGEKMKNKTPDGTPSGTVSGTPTGTNRNKGIEKIPPLPPQSGKSGSRGDDQATSKSGPTDPEEKMSALEKLAQTAFQNSEAQKALSVCGVTSAEALARTARRLAVEDGALSTAEALVKFLGAVLYAASCKDAHSPDRLAIAKARNGLGTAWLDKARAATGNVAKPGWLFKGTCPACGRKISKRRQLNSSVWSEDCGCGAFVDLKREPATDKKENVFS